MVTVIRFLGHDKERPLVFYDTQFNNKTAKFVCSFVFWGFKELKITLHYARIIVKFGTLKMPSSIAQDT